jgi:hypothetical protein
VTGTYALADGRVDATVTLTQGRTQVKARVAGVGAIVRVGSDRRHPGRA